EDEAAELVPALCEEAMKLQDGLTAIELSRAKAQMKAGLLMSLESTSARCEQLAQHLLIYGTPFDPPEVVRRIEAVDDAAIRRVVARWRSAPPTVTALGPLSRLEEYDKLQARLVAEEGTGINGGQTQAFPAIVSVSSRSVPARWRSHLPA